jgi:hypothetical protein
MCWSEKGKGPITSSEKNDVERLTSLALEELGRAYDTKCSPLAHRIRESKFVEYKPRKERAKWLMDN